MLYFLNILKKFTVCYYSLECQEVNICGNSSLLDAPDSLKFSSDYNKIHPLIGALLIINACFLLSLLYYNLTEF